MSLTRTQRWRDRRDQWVPAASTINPADYTVDAIHCVRQAKPFVMAHHYSATFPAARFSAGLFRGIQLVGVCTFAIPMNGASIPKRTGLAEAQGLDLGRFVLLDDVPGNGETWFLARALRLLRAERPEVEAVVSYSDPATRFNAAGQLVKPGHVGLIYQATNAIYRGRAAARTEFATADGQVFSDRAMSKIRARDQGHAYATAELVRRGAPAPGDLDGREWLARLIADGFLQPQRHRGNHVYAFPLTPAAKAAGRGIAAEAYPKLSADAERVAPAQTGFLHGLQKRKDREALPLFAEVI